MDGLSEAEAEELGRRLRCMHFGYAFPRAIQSAVEDVFYLVQTARWHLKRGGRSEGLRERIALRMYELYTMLQSAIDFARDVEKDTGLSGQELAEAADQ